MPVGRPRAFDLEQALERALVVFWRRGYEGASLPDLTKAMGINRPSLYAAFGNKEALFRKVIERYAAGHASYIRKALKAPTARQVVERLFRGAVELLTGPHNPPGCLLVHGALACNEETDSVRRELVAQRAAGESAVRERFQRAKAEGDLSADSSPADLARFVATIIQGMAVQAAGGASRKELRRVAKLALQVDLLTDR
ncbi:MAG: TetR/AcrR family transcriptional regulator [Gemmataceae bacterium]|nr:TetR/AcrR family transcriptional regulator [Gemmataceae bacterium]MCI0739499.1 TetR/AcrR family transcriptional regulator [Gemmataceae bacterium]